MTMLVNDEFKQIIEKKYAEAKTANVHEIVLGEENLGGVKLFIGTVNKPEISFGSFVMEDGVEVYVGGRLFKETVS